MWYKVGFTTDSHICANSTWTRYRYCTSMLRRRSQWLHTYLYSSSSADVQSEPLAFPVYISLRDGVIVLPKTLPTHKTDLFHRVLPPWLARLHTDYWSEGNSIERQPFKRIRTSIECQFNHISYCMYVRTCTTNIYIVHIYVHVQCDAQFSYCTCTYACRYAEMDGWMNGWMYVCTCMYICKTYTVMCSMSYQLL